MYNSTAAAIEIYRPISLFLVCWPWFPLGDHFQHVCIRLLPPSNNKSNGCIHRLYLFDMKLKVKINSSDGIRLYYSSSNGRWEGPGRPASNWVESASGAAWGGCCIIIRLNTGAIHAWRYLLLLFLYLPLYFLLDFLGGSVIWFACLYSNPIGCDLQFSEMWATMIIRVVRHD